MVGEPKRTCGTCGFLARRTSIMPSNRPAEVSGWFEAYPEHRAAPASGTNIYTLLGHPGDEDSMWPADLVCYRAAPVFPASALRRRQKISERIALVGTAELRSCSVPTGGLRFGHLSSDAALGGQQSEPGMARRSAPSTQSATAPTGINTRPVTIRRNI